MSIEKKKQEPIIYHFDQCIDQNIDGDFIIHIGSAQFKYSKMILRRSSVFNTMLNDCTESYCTLSDEDPVHFNLFLNILYTSDHAMDFITEAQYYPMYMLLDKYDIHFLDNYISEACLEIYKISYHSMTLVAFYDDTHNTTKLTKLVLKYMDHHKEFTDIDKLTDDFWIKCLPVITSIRVWQYSDFSKHVVDKIKSPPIKKSFLFLLNKLDQGQKYT